jgi:hypothetical protein
LPEELKMMPLLNSFLAVAFAAPLLGAEVDRTRFEAILLPVKLNSPLSGAFGTAWATNFVAYNSSDREVIYFGGSCPLGIICPGERKWPARSFENPVHYSGNPGYVLFVEREHRNKLAFHLRVFDTARIDVSNGAELPVVWEQDFLFESTQLLDVPINERFRAMLRIYALASLQSRESTLFTVRLFSDGGTLLAQGVFLVTEQLGPLLVFPGYVQVDLGAAFRLTDTLVSRVEITSDHPERPFWAFVSVTDNVTQQVTTRTPQ